MSVTVQQVGSSLCIIDRWLDPVERQEHLIELSIQAAEHLVDQLNEKIAKAKEAAEAIVRDGLRRKQQEALAIQSQIDELQKRLAAMNTPNQ